MPSFMRLAAVLVVALAAISVAVLNLPRGSDQPGGVGSPGPSPTAAPTASPIVSPSTDPRTPSPLDGVATSFPHPFSYHLPEPENLVVSMSDASWYQFRVPKPGTTDEWGNGIVVRLITGGRTDPCSESSASRPLPGGPSAVLVYLKSIRQLDVSKIEALTVDGRPAARSTINPLDPTSDCRDLWLWAELGSYTLNSTWDTTAEVTVVDVDGDHIVILAMGNRDWQNTARGFIDSIHFE